MTPTTLDPAPVSTVTDALADRVSCPVVVCRDGQPPTVMPTTRPGGRPVGGASPVGAGSHP